MCNLYSIVSNQQAIRQLSMSFKDSTGNLPAMLGVFPDYAAPIVCNTAGGRELALVRWGMPSSRKALLDAATKRADKLRANGNVVVYAHISERDRVPMLTSRLLVVEGRVEREDKHAEVPIVHLIASRLIDRSDLLDTLAKIDGQDDGAWAERMLGRAEEVKRPEPGSRRMKMPGTRDFR